MEQEKRWTERYVIHGIRKDPSQEIRIALSEYNGRRLVDLRLFIRNKRGEWIPTRKGCTVPTDQLGELELAVGKLRHALERVQQPA
jgi:hypothetical protein